MTPWPTGVPKPDAVRNYIMDRDTIRQLDDTRNAVAYADAMLAECAETIERLDGILRWCYDYIECDVDRPTFDDWLAATPSKGDK